MNFAYDNIQYTALSFGKYRNYASHNKADTNHPLRTITLSPNAGIISYTDPDMRIQFQFLAKDIVGINCYIDLYRPAECTFALRQPPPVYLQTPQNSQKPRKPPPSPTHST